MKATGEGELWTCPGCGRAFANRNHTDEFRLASPADLDESFQRYLEMAYAVGRQQHLKGRCGHGPAAEG